MSYLVDSHCHLHDREFFTEEQAEKMLKNAKKNGVEKVICIGTNHEDSLEAQKFASAHDDVYWTYGIHPEAAKGEKEATPESIFCEHPQLRRGRNDEPRNDGREEWSQKISFGDDKLVAIGEVGLDYHYEGYDRDGQIKLFEEMLQLAKDNNLPVSFHVREAFDDFFAVAQNFPKTRGVVHSFTDSKKTLKKILETTDFYVGVNGLATYSTLPMPPLEKIILETDAPFLTPTPNRGKINEPAYIKDIAHWLSTKLGVSSDEVAEKTTENVRNLFNI
ncbi:TatD family hydrolase [Candidatus Saccharibacteria bacterium]|nr:TatD family hydrolase [Candidatus Saccharibacteria bacterium]